MARTRIHGLAALVLFTAVFAGRCNRSTPLTPTADCSATLTPTTLSFDAAASGGFVQLVIAPGCAWTAGTSANWLTLTTPSTGSGPATMALAVASNGEESARTGIVTVAGKPISVTQKGTALVPPITCTYAISAELLAFPRTSSSGAVTVTAPAGCGWTSASALPWFILGPESSGSGNGSVLYAVSPNPGDEDRIGTVTIAGRTLTVIQSGNEGVCTYTVATTEFTPCNEATVLETTLTTQAACPWTAVSMTPWISLLSPASGVGPTLIRFSVSASYDAPRSGIVTMRWPNPDDGQNLHVRQAGCRYAVSSSAFSAPGPGGAFGFDVLQESDPTACGGATQNQCMWTPASDSSWIVVGDTTPRHGDGSVGFTVQRNPTSVSRSGTIVVRDQVVRVTQAGS